MEGKYILRDLLVFNCCCLNPFELNPWVAYKRQKFISHSSGDWEPEISVLP